MAEFSILDHLDKLTPDGGKPRNNGDYTYVCPSCEGHNFLVNHDSGWYYCVNGCETRQVRDAIEPPINPNATGAPSPKRSPRRIAKPSTPEPRQPVAITAPINLAALTVRCDQPPASLPDKHQLDYSPTQRVVVSAPPDGKKAHRPRHLGPHGFVSGAGDEPWPAWRQAEALAHGAGRWIAEAEGEKCCDWLRAGGLVAISQPGHDHTATSIERRYRALADAGIQGIAYLADNDATGRAKAQRCAAAAAAVRLAFVVVHASHVWQGIGTGGSIDDADGTPQQRAGAFALAAASAAASSTGLELAAPLAEPSSIDALLGPAEEGKLRRPRTDLLTKVIGLALPLKFNLLTQRIENDGEPIDGDFLGTLYLQLAERYQLDVSKDRACDAATLVARRNAYHPVRDYLQSIPVQLDPGDWDNIALKMFNVADPISQLHLRRQLIGLVGRAMAPGCKLDTALVLHSPRQGIGKSRLWAILGGEWFSDSLGDLRNLKDDILQLHSAWIHEWGEIDAVVGKRESETLKKFLSACRDDVRKPYGRGVDSMKRSCGVVGTTNRSDFIKDPTGNRRFPVISVTTVNTEWVAANRDAIWGSALAAYKAGDQWHYSEQENDQITAAALAYAAEDPLRDQIESWIEDHPHVESVSTPALIYQLDPEQLRSQEFARQVSMRLVSLGWSKSPKRGRGLLPNGDRHDKATFWERATTAPEDPAHCPTTAPENPAHCPTTAPPLPQVTAQQSYQAISADWGSRGSENEGSSGGGLSGQNWALGGSTNTPVFRKESTAHCPTAPGDPVEVRSPGGWSNGFIAVKVSPRFVTVQPADGSGEPCARPADDVRPCQATPAGDFEDF